MTIFRSSAGPEILAIEDDLAVFDRARRDGGVQIDAGPPAPAIVGPAETRGAGFMPRPRGFDSPRPELI